MGVMHRGISELRRLGAGLCVAVLAACGAGCGGGGGSDAPPVPSISLQPATTTAGSGTSVTFSVGATGTGLSYQWQRSVDAGQNWINVAAAIQASYTIAALEFAMNGWKLRAIVSSRTGGSVTTEAATLTVSLPVQSAGQSFRDCADNCPELVRMPTGSYSMGVRAASDWTDALRTQASPVHTVTVSYPLAVGRAEVTRAEFEKFVQATSYVTDAEKGTGCTISTSTPPSYSSQNGTWRTPGFAQTADDPVVCVSWNDARAYVAWLNTVSGVTSYRLLTEAEWEYVARAGQGGARFPWGDDASYLSICTYANFGDAAATATVPRFAGTHWSDCSDGYGYTAPANTYATNAFGLRNVIGNAWEWVEDVWHANYSGAPADGSAWTASGSDTTRLYRGGSWNNHPTYLDPGFRAHREPTYAEEAVGFRVARTL